MSEDIIGYMRAESLQKNADAFPAVSCPYEGVLDPGRFARAVHIQRYKPSPDLAPFVAHLFVARYQLPDQEYVASDVLSHPVAHLIFDLHESRLLGITSGKRTLRLSGIGTYAGVRFRPGGLYPFWRRPMTDIVETTFAVTRVLPQADQTRIASILSCPDDTEVVQYLQSLLREGQPAPNRNIEFVNAVIAAMEADLDLRTPRTIARAFDVSPRTLQHTFHTYVGVGVKWVSMRLRFLEAMRHAHRAGERDWTTLATDLGYATQSHFNHEFKRCIGVPPTTYARHVRNANRNVGPGQGEMP